MGKGAILTQQSEINASDIKNGILAVENGGTGVSSLEELKQLVGGSSNTKIITNKSYVWNTGRIVNFVLRDIPWKEVKK